VSERLFTRLMRRAVIILVASVPLVSLAQWAGPIPDWVLVPAYPPRATEPAMVERGRNLFTGNGCSFCHGADARGGNGGPSLLRSQRLLRDKQGEMIAEPILKGVPNTAMVAFPLKQAEIADIAEFLHSFVTSGGDKARMLPAKFVTGNAAAGKRYFNQSCASCHSVSGDLKGLATRYSEPRTLQQRWLMPSGGAPTTAIVTTPEGAKFNGKLVRIDEFLVTLELADGTQSTFDRDGAVPAVATHDPLAAHKDLLSHYADRDIHNLTAYLVTLK
jgi:cytochrome c oxidase cbb3-type subunit III